jgi:DNA-directed RNA polymerase subunit RPC12/RpoP
MRYKAASFGDFSCAHCGNYVSAAQVLSGVNNRNHCPYCLWSCHLDLFVAGDRLSACKGQMKPGGLTMKESRNKYRLDTGGELMLIHKCIECGDLSINRIAADDDPESITDVFQYSVLLSRQIKMQYERQGIVMVQDVEIVSVQLHGRKMTVPVFERN